MNAGLLAARVISTGMPSLLNDLNDYKKGLEDEVYKKIDKLEAVGWESYKGL